MPLPILPERVTRLLYHPFAIAIVLAGSLIWFGVFIVDPTEMAGVRRLGQVTTREPYGPGIHLKLPIIDQVDRLQVSLDILKVQDLTMYTIDNQWVRISVGLTYRIPPKAVFRLLYQVGQSGSFGIRENVEPIIADRAMRVFARRNTIKISEEREVIANEIRQAVASRLDELFGIEVVDLQIAKIEYSPIFVASVEAAVKAKNDAVAAENTVNRIRFEAEQVRVRAQGEADAAAIGAEGQKRSAVIRADGEAQAIQIIGAAQAGSLRVRGEAVAAHPEAISLVAAERWSGTLPQTLLSERGILPLLNLNAGPATVAPVGSPSASAGK
ncbi:prohibitin family protein [uncultured Thiodictyon sp.]|uniref:SPFH domain-containing protein n=1 Tax=uncultured Thiodictyon sp. TaxID=1846217 RepID=UPI0025E0395F|nr:prohibitin family protein [uncultured Thiodictyon sp.]